MGIQEPRRFPVGSRAVGGDAVDGSCRQRKPNLDGRNGTVFNDSGNWVSTPDANSALGVDWLWVDSNSGNTPIVVSGQEWPVAFYNLEIGRWNAGAGSNNAGLFTQNSGTVSYRYELTVGDSSVTTGVRSMYEMNGGTLTNVGYGSWDYIGQGYDSGSGMHGLGQMDITATAGDTLWDHSGLIFVGYGGGDGILNLTATSAGNATINASGGFKSPIPIMATP